MILILGYGKIYLTTASVFDIHTYIYYIDGKNNCTINRIKSSVKGG